MELLTSISQMELLLYLDKEKCRSQMQEAAADLDGAPAVEKIPFLASTEFFSMAEPPMLLAETAPFNPFLRPLRLLPARETTSFDSSSVLNWLRCIEILSFLSEFFKSQIRWLMWTYELHIFSMIAFYAL